MCELRAGWDDGWRSRDACHDLLRPTLIRVFIVQASLLAAASLSGHTPWVESSAPDVSSTIDSLRPILDRALRTSQSADFDDAIGFVDRHLSVTPGDPVLLHYRGFALFRKASVLTTTPTESRAVRRMLEEADRALEQSSRTLSWPETLALRAAIAGQLIGSSGPFAALRLGPRSARLLGDAVAQGGDNPRVWLLKGIASLYAPKLFGGSPEKAERELQHALSLFTRDRSKSPAPWWGYAETYGWLGQAYARQGRPADARAAYLYALELQPGNSWIMQLLLREPDPGRR